MFWERCPDLSYITSATCHLPESAHLFPRGSAWEPVWEVCCQKGVSSWSALLGTRASNLHWDLNPGPLPASQAHFLDHLTTLFSCMCSHNVSWGFSWYKHVIQDHVMLSTFSYQIRLFWRAETLGHFCPQRGHWMLEMRHFLLSLVLNVLEKLMLPKESSTSFVKKTIYRLININ